MFDGADADGVPLEESIILCFTDGEFIVGIVVVWQATELVEGLSRRGLGIVPV